MSVDEIDVEAGLRRDHQRTITFALVRWTAGVVALAICAITYRCNPEDSVYEAKYWECRRGSE